MGTLNRTENEMMNIFSLYQNVPDSGRYSSLVRGYASERISMEDRLTELKSHYDEKINILKEKYEEIIRIKDESHESEIDEYKDVINTLKGIIETMTIDNKKRIELEEI